MSTSNPLYTPRELAHQISDCGASHILTAFVFAFDTVKEAAELVEATLRLACCTESSICQDAAEGGSGTFSLADESRTAIGGGIVSTETPFDASSMPSSATL